MTLVPSPAFIPPGASIAIRSERRVDLGCTLQAHLDLQLRVSEGLEPHGPRVSLRAALALPELHARVVFRQRTSGNGHMHEELMRQVAVVPPGARIVRVNDRLGSLPAGSRLTLRLIDYEHRPLAEEHVIGECAEGTYELRLPVPVDATASAWVVPKEWTEEHGSTIKVSGALTIRNGILLQIGAWPRRHEEWDAGVRSVGMQLVRPGQTPHYDEKTFDGSFPVNTWALVAFVDEHGQPIGEPQHIGRFVVI